MHTFAGGISSPTFLGQRQRIVGQIRQVGWQDQPFPTGDMVSMNWNGKRKRWIFGQRKQGGRSGNGASILSTLPEEPKKILIAANNFAEREGSYTEAILLDIYNGRERRVTRAPTRNAQLIADHSGTIRYAFSKNPDNDNASEIHQKTDEGWELVVAFHRRKEASYRWASSQTTSQSTSSTTPNLMLTLLELNPKTGERRDLQASDCDSVAGDGQKREPGWKWSLTTPHVPIDTASAFGQSLDHIHNTFKGYRVNVSSVSKDGALMTLSVESDVSPKIFFLYQTQTKQFVHLADIFPAVRRTWRR